MQAKDIMTSPVITVKPKTSVLEAVKIMLQDRIGGLPVVDETGKVVGIVSESDLLRRHELGTERYTPRWIEAFRTPKVAEEYVSSHGRFVSEIMTTPVECVDPEASLAEVVDLLERQQVNRVPVAREGQLLGIISRADLLRAFARHEAEKVEVTPSDAEIRDALLAELAREEWMLPTTARAEVRDAVVSFRGVIPDERYRSALKIAAENIPGVKDVEDFLVIVNPADTQPAGRMKFIPAAEGRGMGVE
jgi:CBS domain-containing protein